MPLTSPAAYTPGTFVLPKSSVTIAPRFVSTPSFSRPMFAVSARRPIETRTLSTLSFVTLPSFSYSTVSLPKDVTLDISGLSGDETAKFYLLDEEHDMTLVKEEAFGDMKEFKLNLPPYTTYLIEIS